jgi:TolB-like protein
MLAATLGSSHRPDLGWNLTDHSYLITSRKYDVPNLDLQKAGNEMGVSVVIAGHFLTEQNKLQLSYEAVDVADNHILWRDTIISPLQNLIDAREQLYKQAQGGLAAALGARPAPENAAR